MAQLPLLLLLGVKALLLLWGLLGLAEYLAPSLALGLQNAGFPPGTQLLHWILLLLSGSCYVVGYLARWRRTVPATITLYACLATLCFIETVDFGAFGGGPARYLVMTGEFALYLVLSLYLARARAPRERFGRGRASASSPLTPPR